MSLLRIESLKAGYGHSQVLFDINIEVAEGEVVTLLGRNGMGKSTTIKCLSGLHRASGGAIHFAGSEVSRWPAYRMGRAGIGLVPEGRHVFPNLTVRENLVATAADRRKVARPWTLERV